jgi:hypothetical protein
MFLFGFFLGIVACFFLLRFIQRWDKRVVFCYILDLNSQDVLPEVERLIEGLNLSVLNKKLIRDDSLKLEFSFRSHPFVQHVFLKRLLVLEGVGQIVKI